MSLIENDHHLLIRYFTEKFSFVILTRSNTMETKQVANSLLFRELTDASTIEIPRQHRRTRRSLKMNARAHYFGLAF